ncbi:ribosome small subunit-dependent GTPase A [Sediminitomix flava]|uniref:Small ribosomal subunit biogenesis GTPase RsgA n=1 Tax=Sediminitomix flava TaxID=379075 RepID=A0A315ZXC5_SEDFL|nr:ribosome small subunit-dependent GTPase A [Sediminitomix flava]PWJ41997.1 ribosome biogenesis GTPase [Sediminitomix flava]
MTKGLIVRSTGSWYDIFDEENQKSYKGRLRGRFKLKGMKVTNPIAVGDYVHFELENESENTVVITELLKRDNYIIRQSTRKKYHGHVIAANIDQAILIATLVSPRTSLGFIDRFLVSAESFGIPVTIAFNKCDLLLEEDLEYQEQLMALYENLGYNCVAISALTDDDTDIIDELILGKKSLLAGHSGVGKSTLINRIDPNISQRTDEISTFADKGKHTTTFAQMFQVNDNSFVIDTPGIKELGIIGLEDLTIGHFFPEIKDAMGHCKYHNCTHVHEPNCEVLKRVEGGKIALPRYQSYLSILNSDDNRR